jgi:uncharacterized protein YbaP (TraB family)
MRNFSVSPQDALLWKIYGNEIRDTSYIYGTIHLRDRRVFAYADTVLTYMSKCDKLVLEIDLNPLNLMQSSHLIMLPADSTLNDIFKPDDLVIIKKVFKEVTGMDFAAVEKLKPVVLLSLVIQQKTKGDMCYTLDEYLYQKGLKTGREIIGLETFEEQLGLLETIPLEDIAEYLKSPTEDAEELEMMVCCYLESDIDDLLCMMQNDETMIALKREFLDDRNRKMTGIIDQLLHNSKILVAVGAGHLPGDHGIIQLLKQKGHTVEPVVLKVPENLKCVKP